MADVGEREILDTDEPDAVPETTQRSRFRSTTEVILLYALCLFVALALAAICVSATGGSWSNVYTAMLDGSIRKPGRWGLTMGVSAPILLVALGTIVNSRAGLVNIGQEGQLIIGSSLSAYVAVRLAGPGPLVLILAMQLVWGTDGRSVRDVFVAGREVIRDGRCVTIDVGDLRDEAQMRHRSLLDRADLSVPHVWPHVDAH